jgi:hypothetical protein
MLKFAINQSNCHPTIQLTEEKKHGSLEVWNQLEIYKLVSLVNFCFVLCGCDVNYSGANKVNQIRDTQYVVSELSINKHTYQAAQLLPITPSVDHPTQKNYPGLL